MQNMKNDKVFAKYKNERLIAIGYRVNDATPDIVGFSFEDISEEEFNKIDWEEMVY